MYRLHQLLTGSTSRGTWGRTGALPRGSYQSVHRTGACCWRRCHARIRQASPRSNSPRRSLVSPSTMRMFPPLGRWPTSATPALALRRPRAKRGLAAPASRPAHVAVILATPNGGHNNERHVKRDFDNRARASNHCLGNIEPLFLLGRLFLLPTGDFDEVYFTQQFGWQFFCIDFQSIGRKSVGSSGAIV